MPTAIAGRRPHAALALVAALALLSGCGGGGGGGGALTKSEFVAKGDEVCRQGDQQYAQLQQNPPKTAADAASLTQKLIDVTNNEVTQIRDLDAPAEVKPALERYLRAREQGVAVLEHGLKAAQDNDFRAYAAAQAKMAAGQVDRLKLAQAVGFAQCSRPAGTSSGA
jgi:hypothetical protein